MRRASRTIRSNRVGFCWTGGTSTVYNVRRHPMVFPDSHAPRRMTVLATALATAALVGASLPIVAQDDVTVTFRTRPDNDAEAEVYAQVAAQISEQLDGITVEYQKGGSETSSYQDQLKTEAASGTAPDVFWIPGTDIAEFATNGIIADLREYADASRPLRRRLLPGPHVPPHLRPCDGRGWWTALGPAARRLDVRALHQQRPHRRGRRRGPARAGRQRRVDLGQVHGGRRGRGRTRA